MDLLQLKKSALLYVGAASLIIILVTLRVRVMWMLQDFGNILWLFCIGFTFFLLWEQSLPNRLQ